MNVPDNIEAHKPPKVIISCMDRRLNEYLDGYKGPHDAVLRNAGANVKGLKSSIEKLMAEGYKVFEIAAHTDCGAMKYAKAALEGSIIPSDAEKEFLISQFNGKDPASLERINASVQFDEFKRMLDNKGISNVMLTSRTIDLDKIHFDRSDNQPHFLSIIMGTSPVRYLQLQLDMSAGSASSYFIQAERIAEVLPDIGIAVGALHLSDVRLIESKPVNKESLREAEKILASESIFTSGKAALTVVTLNGRKLHS
jgi:hypothetical protein